MFEVFMNVKETLKFYPSFSWSLEFTLFQHGGQEAWVLVLGSPWSDWGRGCPSCGPPLEQAPLGLLHW